ncbi:hypothetical protein [Zoogloea sp.]|uniref:hypothetical protein n=1 Tax=Zoogloea sp. TaxID=49181 RepID=UPI0014158378|nr:MAG: hypothetical protein F9K15_14445 [Zoogloea sp.]
MNRLAKSGIAIALAGMMIGCAPRYADVPAPTRFENTKQDKLQAAEHWHKIAEHFAGQLATDLRDKLGGRAIHVPLPGGEQPFVDGFRELLTTALVAQGLPVSTEPRNALSVDVRYSIYRFQPDRAKSTYYYGDATAITAGLWAIGAVAASNISPNAGISAGVKTLAAVSGIEGFAWVSQEAMGRGQYASGPVPRSEILLTASVADGSRIVSRRSNIYYAADEDKDLYWARPARTHTIPVMGDCGERSKLCAR